MRNEFDFDHIRSVEFCVNVLTNGGNDANYLVPIDQSVQDALKQVLEAMASNSRAAGRRRLAREGERTQRSKKDHLLFWRVS